MFKLSRYFSLTSLLAFAVVIVLLANFYYQQAHKDLLEQAELNNTKLTQVFANTLWPEFDAFINSAGQLSPDEINAHPETQRLRTAVMDQMQGLSVLKVKIYNLDALTVFSTDSSQIGENKSSNAGYLAARAGEVVSELTHRDSFSAFEEVIEDKDVFSSYLPIKSKTDGSVEAVFELYTDVTPLLDRIQQTRRNIVFGVTAILLTLYLLLYFIVKRADLILKKQHNETQVSKEALRQSEERYMLAAKGANDGLWDWGVEADTIYVSARWQAMLGHEEKECIFEPNVWFNQVHPEDIMGVKEAIDKHLMSEASKFEFSYRMQHKDGSYRWMHSRGYSVRDDKGQVYRMAGSQTDITDRKQAEDQLQHDALHDSLTKLPNRTLLNSRLQQAFKYAARNNNYSFALMFLDLDRFKFINDSLGHETGDQLLIAVAERLRVCIRDSDTLSRNNAEHVVSRLGGDEFTIVLDDIETANTAKLVAERILASLTKPFFLNEHKLCISASIGIALYEPDFKTPEAMLRAADNAMYRAKALGKARYALFDADLSSQLSKKLEIESDLRKALTNNELELHYQPIVCLESGQIVSFESLIRWQHPVRGFIPPLDFIPLAEESGLISSLGLWVLKEACQQLSRWQRSFSADFCISVNVSSIQLSDTSFIRELEAILTEIQVNAKHLKLELTETVLMDRDETAIATIHALKALGVSLEIDDFGTGFSSLSYLHSFPIDALKIDRSFIFALDTMPESQEIVKTVINLGHNLGLKVIAEGIETPEQKSILRQLGCEIGQGYLFSKPLPPVAAEAFIQANNVQGELDKTLA